MNKNLIKIAFQLGYASGMEKIAQRNIPGAYVAPPPPAPTQGFAGRHRDMTGHALRGQPALNQNAIPNPWAEQPRQPSPPMQPNQQRSAQQPVQPKQPKQPVQPVQPKQPKQPKQPTQPQVPAGHQAVSAEQFNAANEQERIRRKNQRLAVDQQLAGNLTPEQRAQLDARRNQLQSRIDELTAQPNVQPQVNASVKTPSVYKQQAKTVF